MLSILDRYPAPWRPDEMTHGWRVIAANDVVVAYVYVHDGTSPIMPARDGSGTIFGYVSRAEAHAIAHAIARLPELLLF